MTDDFYKKQLEEFGIESTRVVEGNLEKKRAEERKASTTAVIKYLMSEMAGRHWLYSVLDMCRTFTSPFVPGQPDVTAFFSGAQALGHRLLADIMEVAPENYYVMVQEEAARKSTKRDQE